MSLRRIGWPRAACGLGDCLDGSSPLRLWYQGTDLLLSDDDALCLAGMGHDPLTLQGFLELVPDEGHAEALFLLAR